MYSEHIRWKRACSTNPLPSRTRNSTILQISSQIFRIPEHMRVTNVLFYDGRWSVVKKREVKNFKAVLRNSGDKSFYAQPGFLLCRCKNTVTPLIFARDSIFVQLTRGTIACFLLRWWASAITSVIMEKHIWLESARISIFFFTFAKRFVRTCFACALVFMHGLLQSSHIFLKLYINSKN